MNNQLQVTDFAQLSTDQCRTLCQKMLDNADRLWKKAGYNAADGDYGLGLSLTISSTEELVKGFIFFLDSKGFEFRKIPRIDKLLHNHHMKYTVAFGMFTATISAEIIKDALISMKQQPIFKLSIQLPDPEKGTPAESKFELNIDKTRIARYLVEKLNQAESERAWFAQMETLRQSGVYVDYTDKLNTPSDTTKDDYELVRSKIGEVKKFAEFTMRALNSQDKETQQILAEALAAVKNGGYTDIGELLKDVKGAFAFDSIKTKMKSWLVALQNTGS